MKATEMTRKNPFNPADMIALSFEMGRLMFEAQTVITLRMLGMGGFWGRSGNEDRRMVTEKQTAFTKAGLAMWGSAMRGGSPEKITSAGIRPLRRTTKANVARLSKKGPRIPMP